MTVSIRDGALVDRPDKDRRGGVANYPVATVRIDHAGLTVDVYISVRGVTAECRSDSGAHSTEWMSFLYEPEEED